MLEKGESGFSPSFMPNCTKCVSLKRKKRRKKNRNSTQLRKSQAMILTLLQCVFPRSKAGRTVWELDRNGGVPS